MLASYWQKWGRGVGGRTYWVRQKSRRDFWTPRPGREQSHPLRYLGTKLGTAPAEATPLAAANIRGKLLRDPMIQTPLRDLDPLGERAVRCGVNESGVTNLP